MSWYPACTIGIGRGNGSGDGAVAGVGLTLGVVLRRPLRGCFICPFDVAGLGIRYFRTVFAVRCGAPFRKPALIALSNGDIGGLHKLWCMNLTSFSLLVRWYKQEACYAVSLLSILVGVVLHGNIVFGIIVRGDDPTRIHTLRKYVGQAEGNAGVETVRAKQ